MRKIHGLRVAAIQETQHKEHVYALTPGPTTGRTQVGVAMRLGTDSRTVHRENGAVKLQGTQERFRNEYSWAEFCSLVKALC